MTNLKSLLGAILLLTGCGERVELTSTPPQFRGTWQSDVVDPPVTLRINAGSIRLSSSDESHTCDIETAVSSGPGLLGSGRQLRVICDRASTLRYQERNRPFRRDPGESYRKQYFLTFPDERGVISVSETIWMSQGTIDSYDAYTWPIDDFYPQ